MEIWLDICGPSQEIRNVISDVPLMNSARVPVVEVANNLLIMDAGRLDLIPREGKPIRLRDKATCDLLVSGIPELLEPLIEANHGRPRRMLPQPLVSVQILPLLGGIVTVVHLNMALKPLDLDGGIHQ